MVHKRSGRRLRSTRDDPPRQAALAVPGGWGLKSGGPSPTFRERREETGIANPLRRGGRGAAAGFAARRCRGDPSDLPARHPLSSKRIRTKSQERNRTLLQNQCLSPQVAKQAFLATPSPSGHVTCKPSAAAAVLGRKRDLFVRCAWSWARVSVALHLLAVRFLLSH